jgi:hypothetical protein
LGQTDKNISIFKKDMSKTKEKNFSLFWNVPQNKIKAIRKISALF